MYDGGHFRILKAGLIFVAVCVALPGCAARAAAAEEYDPVTVVLGSSIIYDSNLFRLPGFVDPQAVLGKPTKSDTIKVVYAGLRVSTIRNHHREHQLRVEI